MQHLRYLYFEMPQANITKSDVPGAIIGGLIGGAVGAWGGDYYGEQAAKAIIK